MAFALLWLVSLWFIVWVYLWWFSLTCRPECPSGEHYSLLFYGYIAIVWVSMVHTHSVFQCFLLHEAQNVFRLIPSFAILWSFGFLWLVLFAFLRLVRFDFRFRKCHQMNHIAYCTYCGSDGFILWDTLCIWSWGQRPPQMSASDAHITPGVKCGVKWCGGVSHITPGVAGCQVEIQYQPHKSCSDALLNLVVEE